MTNFLMKTNHSMTQSDVNKLNMKKFYWYNYVNITIVAQTYNIPKFIVASALSGTPT